MDQNQFDSFQKLNDSEKQILMALAILYLPTSQGSLSTIIERHGILATSNATKIVRSFRENLGQLKLLMIDRNGFSCLPQMRHFLIQSAKSLYWFHSLINAQERGISPYYHYSQPTEITPEDAKEMFLSLYLKNDEFFLKKVFELSLLDLYGLKKFLKKTFFNPFYKEWFLTLNIEVRLYVLYHLLNNDFSFSKESTLHYDLLKELIDELQKDPFKKTIEKVKSQAPNIFHLIFEQDLLRGKTINNLENYLSLSEEHPYFYLFSAMSLFFQNNYLLACEQFTKANTIHKKGTLKQKRTIYGIAGCFFRLSLFRNYCLSPNIENFKLLRHSIDGITEEKIHKTRPSFYHFNIQLTEILKTKTGHEKEEINYQNLLSIEGLNPYERFFHVLFLYWIDELNSALIKFPDLLKELASFSKNADLYGHTWYAQVSSALLIRLNYTFDENLALINKGHPHFELLLDLIPPITKWQRSLNSLKKLVKINPILEPPSEKPLQLNFRLIWGLAEEDGEISLVPYRQKITKNGKTGVATLIQLKNLYGDVSSLDYLTEQDKDICKMIIKNHFIVYNYKKDYYWEESALKMAVGHPHIYWDINSSPIELTLSKPQLLVKKSDQNLHLSLYPQIINKKIITLKTTNNGLIIYDINFDHEEVAKILGSEGLTIPWAARHEAINSLSSLASLITIQSDIEGSQLENTENIKADGRLHIQLAPLGEGLQVEFFIQPFHEIGPYYKPGKGGATVLAVIDGKQLQTTRDFDLECLHLNTILEECPGLSFNENYKWFLDDYELSLEALLYFQNLGEQVILEWPKGKKVQLSKELDLSHAMFSIDKEKDWFGLQGQLQINEQDIIGIQNLIYLIKQAPGRFLKLENGQIIALTRELRKRLDEISNLGDLQGEKILFPTLIAQTLDDITDGMNLKCSHSWKKQLQRMDEVRNLEIILPSTFQGELRDYQIEGYQWMARLSHLGAGACLADDMGLGKTIQALALILSRASLGPTLILAPSSVCLNWPEECQRFAPTLNVYQFGSGDRQNMLDHIGPFDVVICSYGLLQTEEEKLTQKHWSTIVADEAQAIKNSFTKRSQAAMALHADFKLITTGTPIENHLGELWNLFHFINPGLLGTSQKFNQRYGDNNPKSRQSLKKLLRPFILRRLKNDVLTELPPRTEVTLHIELSKDERAIYEVIRRQAIAIAENSQNKSEQNLPLKILGEILKLRRACCHPSLALPENYPLPANENLIDGIFLSSKLEAFLKLVEDLLENHHKAIVFSQFIGHLSLIRQLLDKKGIRYHYLDGQTPMADRKTAIDSFQDGHADLFLISLKAGGTGINLTAADYVIHMDPWWNPAVEDQASDRAHRMGQKRPVTIYRLIAQNTIEEKMIELHKHKRDLANSLLEGGEISGKMSVDEMLKLIEESHDV